MSSQKENMLDREELKSLLMLYKDHVEKVLLPFWNKALDYEHGGIYTCFNNQGDELKSKDKFTWSQGRYLWVGSKIVSMISDDKLQEQNENYLDHLHKTASFLEENVFLENGNCTFLLSETGEKKVRAAEKFDSSIYADCFVALGLGKFAGLTNDPQRFERVLELYYRIRERIDDGNIRTEPYPISSGYRAHSISMIMLNVVQELAEISEQLNHQKTEELYQHSILYIEDIMNYFYQDSHRVVEMLPKKSSSQRESLLYRHVNPGHTIESMWFVISTAQKTDHFDYISQAIKAIEKAVSIGWDDRYGGLLRFVDKEGGKPKGKESSTPYEQLIIDSWDMKLWWPHSEALFATLEAFFLTGNKNLLKQYKKIQSYVFDTFPNPDKEIGEWIQIRNRKGTPIDEIAALPVKDPFHILRNMLLIIELLEDSLYLQ